jgi:hypothetical protein
MTLILWKAPITRDEEKAAEMLRPYYEREDDSAFEPSSDLTVVRDRLLQEYPFDPQTGSEPWADGLELTGRLLLLSIRWGADGRILADITALARIHELVLYDPQGPDIFLPDDPIEELTEIPPFKVVEWLKILGIVSVLSVLTYAAWQIPSWLRWPAVIIVGFIASAAWFVLGCMIFGRRIMQSANTRS